MEQSIFYIGAPFILGLTTSFFVLNIGLVVLIGSRHSVSRIFAAMSAATAVWVFLDTLAFSVSGIQTTSPLINFLMTNNIRAAYTFGLLLSLSLFYFCYRFPDTPDPSSKVLLRLAAVFAIITPLLFFTDLMTESDPEWYIAEGSIGMGPLMPVYTIVATISIVGGFFLLVRKMLKTSDALLKKQLQFALGGIIAGFGLPLLFDLILPLFGNTDYEFYGILAPNVWVAAIAYSMMKYHHMNVKVVSTEALVLTAIFLLFITIFM